MKSSQELADEHWNWVEGLFVAIGEEQHLIQLSEYLYKTAFVHGFKHALECQEEFLNGKH